ncbi:hypothetical protein MPSEU_000587600 [Mayamaea pseudoterrestris]|nr:hypothetical protein MPSEU_000587600 [Mayamaea pseudoterrestris]
MMLTNHTKALRRLAGAAASNRALAPVNTRCLSEAATSTITPSSPPPGPPPIVWTTHRLNQDSIKKVDAIFHKILWLDMIETSLLTEEMNRRMGIVLTPKQHAALTKQLEKRHSDSNDGSDGIVEEAVAETVKLVDLKLTGFDEKSKIKVIKEVRSIAGLGLKEAKELVEGFPKTIQKGLTPEAAEELKAKLEAVGAKVDLV